MSARLHNKLVRGKGAKTKPIPVKIVYDNATAAPTVDDKWRVRDAISTLQRAEEIRRDKTMMRAVKTEVKTMVKDLSKVR